MLNFAIQITTIEGKIYISPLLEILTHSSTLSTALNLLHGWHYLTLGSRQRQVKLNTLHEESDIGLPVVLGIFGTHQIATKVVANLTRLQIVVLLGFLVIVIGEYLRPNTSHGAGIVLADGIVGTKGKLGTLGERNLERVIAFGLATEGAGDPAKEIIEV